MKRFTVVILGLLMLSNVHGVVAQSSQGYVPFTETITIDPTIPGWQSTGIVIKGGASISATGQVNCDIVEPIWHLCEYRGPEGLGPLGLYSLAGRIGDGPAFPVTSGTQVFTGDGELELRYIDNDYLYYDNGGTYDVTVSSCRPGNGDGDTNNCHFGAPGEN